MNQINSNLKTLAQLCYSSDSPWNYGVGQYQSFITQNTNQGTGANIVVPSGFLTFIIKNFNATLADQAAYLYGQIIFLFAHAIPYNQNTQSYTFQTSSNSSIVYQMPDIWFEIDSYMTLYQNRILQYLTNTIKYETQ